ncbi:protein-glutamine gamma-glutamyltransferase [Bacillus paralicheniformis]|uniref:protein-glutamine gamma-glutamyltransferase n=1 Tax=Bacillus paralicheniformis TaxID=1648923 RepID=UPI00210A95F3|nr:protein-glutamine gamma-glutamyltransferase [Bacillus paralicheniformis]MCQ5457527.1 protein-glutamine gamma-glutamyltransferase [Bacillus paralicheniformis]
MISVSGYWLRPEDIEKLNVSQTQRDIANRMLAMPSRYRYGSISELLFELRFRVHTVESARELINSGAKFATFSKTYGNEEFWRVTPEGALELKYRAPASKAIRNIFESGSLYAFECATAIVIIFYMALLKTIGDQTFDRNYQRIILYDWHYERLPIYTDKGNDYLPGDCLYFKNPEFDPERPQWRGENAILLENNLYAAHGLGILSGETIIEKLNGLRKPHAQTSAYLLSQVTRVDISALIQMIR